MSQRVRVKICGVTSVEDALLAANLGAEAVGLNFYEKSPRFIDASKAYEILRALPAFVEPVGLFVRRSLREIAATLKEPGLDRIRTVQRHADQPEIGDFFVYPFSLIDAFPVADVASLGRIQTYLADAWDQAFFRPGAILVDAHVPGKYGGTGQTAPWQLLAAFAPTVPLILAGGLTPDNVAEAIRIVRPYAVDVASGVESSPGKKDPDKMQRFIENARAALG